MSRLDATPDPGVSGSQSPRRQSAAYARTTRAEAEAAFREDAHHAAAAGYTPVSQEWVGSTLQVTYEYQPSVAAPAVQPPPAQAVQAPLAPQALLAPPVRPLTPVKKSHAARNLFLFGIAAFAIYAFVLRTPGDRGSASTAGGQAGRAPVTRSTPQPRVAAEAIPDGTHRVGSDIRPGTYRSRVPVNCYWARLAGFSGDLDDIIANANVSGYAVVTIKPSDEGFETNGCEWSADVSAVISPSSGEIPDGMFVVGKDIKPGTYRTTGSCYWARLSGFGGELGDIIANDNSSGSAIVEIARGDVGFEIKRLRGVELETHREQRSPRMLRGWGRGDRTVLLG